MPIYEFRLPLSVEPERLELDNDQAAWSRTVMFVGELLQDIDGGLPQSTDWTARVSEGGRTVATIKVTACLHSHID